MYCTTFFHVILILYDGGKAECKLCNLCGVEEDVAHLLYNCNFATSIWRDYEMCTGINVILEDVVLGVKLDKTNRFVVSVRAYLIYKQWLLCSLKSVYWAKSGTLKLLNHDLGYRANIYTCLGWSGIANAFNMLLS